MIQSASDGTSASQCRLICSSGYVASNVQPYLCKADSATTAAYDMAQDGSITCTAATCASIEVAYSDKSSGTGTSKTTGTVAVACDDGYSGSANAVCTADNGAETATFAAFTPCAAATCASIEVANSNKDSTNGGTGTSRTTETVAVACNDGYSGSGNATCTADVGNPTATFASFTPCAANDCIATIAFADDGSNGNFYCINGGVIGGTTGACSCTQCDSIFMGGSCETLKEVEHNLTPEQLVASMTGTLNGVSLPWDSSFAIQTMGSGKNTAVTQNAAGFPTITITCGECKASSVSDEMQRQFNDEEVCTGLAVKDRQSSCSSEYDIVWMDGGTDGSIIITVTPKSNDTDNTVIYVAIAIGVLLAIVIIVAVVFGLNMMNVKGGQPADSAAASEEGASGAAQGQGDAQGQGNSSAIQLNDLHKP